jgi:hypothetical protein
MACNTQVNKGFQFVSLRTVSAFIAAAGVTGGARGDHPQ